MRWRIACIVAMTGLIFGGIESWFLRLADKIDPTYEERISR
jgi:hypothetical protein